MANYSISVCMCVCVCVRACARVHAESVVTCRMDREPPSVTGKFNGVKG